MKAVLKWVLGCSALFPFSAQSDILAVDDIYQHVSSEKQHLVEEVIALNKSLPDDGIRFCDLKNLSEMSCLRRITSHQYVYDFNTKEIFKVGLDDAAGLPNKLLPASEVELEFGKVFTKSLKGWQEKHKDSISIMIEKKKLMGSFGKT